MAKKKEMALADEEDFGSSRVGKWRSWVWSTMEYPWTSNTARYTSAPLTRPRWSPNASSPCYPKIRSCF